MKSTIAFFTIALIFLSFFVILSIESNKNNAAQNDELVLLEPKHNGIITNTSPLFSWRGNANLLILDDNAEFSSPVYEEIQGPSHQLNRTLAFGDHYWKLEGKKKSNASKFSIESIVAIHEKRNQTHISLANAGNTKVSITHYADSALQRVTGFFVLQKDESFTSKSNGYMVIEQHE